MFTTLIPRAVGYQMLLHNASPMKKVWTILKKDYQTLVTLHCLAHTLHLVIKDILRFDPFTSVVSNFLKLTKHFLSHHQPKAVLEKCIQTRSVDLQNKLSIPGDTRWGSHFRMVGAISNARLASHNLVFIATEELRKRNAYP